MQKVEAIGQLTGGIAHDFNNMLAVVIGSLDMAQKRLDKGETPRAMRLVDNAMEGAQRAARLTARLLAFSRQQPLEPQAIDANKLVGGMSEILRRTIGDDIRMETVLAGGLWPTFADPGPARKRDPEPVHQWPRRDAGGRQADRRDRQLPSRRCLCRGASRSVGAGNM